MRALDISFKLVNQFSADLFCFLLSDSNFLITVVQQIYSESTGVTSLLGDCCRQSSSLSLTFSDVDKCPGMQTLMNDDHSPVVCLL